MPRNSEKFHTVKDDTLNRVTVIRKGSKAGDDFNKYRGDVAATYGKTIPDVPAKARRRTADEVGASFVAADTVGKAAGDRYAERSKYAKK